MLRRNILGTLGAVAVASAMPARAQAPALDAPAGRYDLDVTHASLLWRISHFGLSNYTARFTRFDAHVDFDPADLSKCSAAASIDLASVETDYPAGLNKRDWNADLRGSKFFNVEKFARANWRSTGVKLLEPRRLRIAGELSLLGVTAPVSLEATLNGVFRSRPVTRLPTIGFSARGTFDRRGFGLGFPSPEEGIGASVEIIIEAEFMRRA